MVEFKISDFMNLKDYLRLKLKVNRIIIILLCVNLGILGVLIGAIFSEYHKLNWNLILSLTFLLNIMIMFTVPLLTKKNLRKSFDTTFRISDSYVEIEYNGNKKTINKNKISKVRAQKFDDYFTFAIFGNKDKFHDLNDIFFPYIPIKYYDDIKKLIEPFKIEIIE